MKNSYVGLIGVGLFVFVVAVLAQPGVGPFAVGSGNINSNQLPVGVVFTDKSPNQTITQSLEVNGGFSDIGSWTGMPNQGGSVGNNPNQPRVIYGGNTNAATNITTDFGPQLSSPGPRVFISFSLTDITTNRLGFGTPVVMVDALGRNVYGGVNGDNWGSIGLENGHGIYQDCPYTFQIINNNQAPIAIEQAFSVGGYPANYQYLAVTGGVSHFTFFEPGKIGVGSTNPPTDVVTIDHINKTVVVNAPITMNGGNGLVINGVGGYISEPGDLYIGGAATSGQLRFSGGPGIVWTNSDNIGGPNRFMFCDINNTKTWYATWRVGNSGIDFLAMTNGLATTLSNTIAPTSFTFPLTTVNWTNTNSFNIELYIDNSGVTGSATKKNGTTIFSSLVGDVVFHLQPGEYFSETYTVGTPSARFSPF